MANDTVFPEVAVEIAPLAEGLVLQFAAQWWEDEQATVPAPNIVYSDEKYYVELSWWFEGNLALTRHFCGWWQVKIDLESIGKAKEYSSQCVEVEMDPCYKGTKENPYSYTFELTPGTVEPQECGTVYLVAVTLATLDVCRDPGHIWGYAKGPSVMFVEARPHED
jgi:hypothetical protein